MDFASDALWTGRRMRCVWIVNNATRESPAPLPDFAIAANGVVRLLDELACQQGLATGLSWTTGRNSLIGRGCASSDPASRSRTGCTDMRCGMNGLALQVRDTLRPHQHGLPGQDPYSMVLFDPCSLRLSGGFSNPTPFGRPPTR
jgi:hypothetical protein